MILETIKGRFQFRKPTCAAPFSVGSEPRCASFAACCAALAPLYRFGPALDAAPRATTRHPGSTAAEAAAAHPPEGIIERLDRRRSAPLLARSAVPTCQGPGGSMYTAVVPGPDTAERGRASSRSISARRRPRSADMAPITGSAVDGRGRWGESRRNATAAGIVAGGATLGSAARRSSSTTDCVTEAVDAGDAGISRGAIAALLGRSLGGGASCSAAGNTLCRDVVFSGLTVVAADSSRQAASATCVSKSSCATCASQSHPTEAHASAAAIAAAMCRCRRLSTRTAWPGLSLRFLGSCFLGKTVATWLSTRGSGRAHLRARYDPYNPQLSPILPARLWRQSCGPQSRRRFSRLTQRRRAGALASATAAACAY